MKKCDECGRAHSKDTLVCGACYTAKQRAKLAGSTCSHCGLVKQKFVTKSLCARCYQARRNEKWHGACSGCGKERALKTDRRLCQTCRHRVAAKAPVECPQCKRMAPPFLRGVCRSCYFMRSRLKKKYGLSAERYWEMREEQGDHCAICAQTMEKTPHVDHDHSTGVVRSLLCDRCNVGLGSFEDNPERLRAAAKYIEAHRARKVA